MMSGGVSQARSEVLKLAMAAVVLAAGVELFTAPVLGPVSAISIACVAIGVALTGVVLGYLLHGALRGAGIKKIIHGNLFVKSSDFTPIEVDGYRFGSDANHYLKGLFAENSAYYQTWSFMSGEKNSVENPRKPNERMVLELYEYFFLNQLSMHLSEAFNNEFDENSNRVYKFNRNDIPSILLSNRFLETFSKDMNDRSAFAGRSFNSNIDSSGGSRVVYAFGHGGAIFDHFELVLPKGSKVSRCSDGSLVIETSKFVLSTRASFYGFHGSTPFGFEELYMGMSSNNVDSRMIEAELELKFKVSAILAPGGWKYFDWAESFIEKFEQQFSFESFLSSIFWTQSYTTAKILAPKKGKRALLEIAKLDDPN